MKKDNLKIFHGIGLTIFVFLFFKEMYFDNIPACSKAVSSLGAFSEQIGYAFISGYVFYVMYEYFYRRPIATRRLHLVKNKINRLVGTINKLGILFYLTTKESQSLKISLNFDDFDVNEDQVFWTRKIENLNKQIYYETSGELRTISPSYGDEIRDLMKTIHTNGRSILSETLIFQHNDYIDFEEKLIKLMDSDFFEKIKKQKAIEISRESISLPYRIKGQDAKEFKKYFLSFLVLRDELFREIQQILKESDVEHRNKSIDENFQFIHNFSMKQQ